MKELSHGFYHTNHIVIGSEPFDRKARSLLPDGQSRWLGNVLDAQYHQIDDFSNYVGERLDDLTPADVTRLQEGRIATR